MTQREESSGQVRNRTTGEQPHLWLLHAAAFKLRGIVMVVPIAAMLLIHRWAWADTVGTWLCGTLLFLSGWLLRIWSQGHLKYRLRVEHELATTGPYAWMRNPVYLGNVLILSGLSVLCGLPWLAPAVCLWALLVYALAVPFEESRLTRRYGETYAEYCSVVPRWWPQKTHLSEREQARAATWSQVLGAEWHCALFLVVPVFKSLVFA